MLIQELSHIETAEDIYIEGAAVGQTFFASSVGTGPRIRSKRRYCRWC